MPSHELGFKARSFWLQGFVQGLWSLSSHLPVLTEGQCVFLLVPR